MNTTFTDSSILPNLTFTNNPGAAVDKAVESVAPDSLFVIADTNTFSLVLPRLRKESKAVENAKTITVNAGETAKCISTLSEIWQQLGDNGASRKSAVLNLGGGVITDMGAFAASTFKRGIPFINLPTTLMGAVDASAGGKTGINFNNLKNEIGLFSNAQEVIISTKYFSTLPATHMLAGYAEMMKHAMLTSKAEVAELLNIDITGVDTEKLLQLVQKSVEVKCRFVKEDFNDNGIRRALNFGHTAAHAFETIALKRKQELPHGYAVAMGMAVELVLSHLKAGFPSSDLQVYSKFVSETYGTFNITCNDYGAILQAMRHDKKNPRSGNINFTLLNNYGNININNIISDDEIKTALDIYRDLMNMP